MAGDAFEVKVLNEDLRNLKIEPSPPPPLPSSSKQQQDPAAAAAAVGGLEINCFTDIVDNVTLHFQIIRLPKQIYAWVGCNSAKFGHLYAAASTRPNNGVSVTSLLGGGSDNTGSGIARRIVLKTGLSVVLACNIPKNSPMLEANAEKKLIEKLIHLGYTRPKSEGFPS